MVNIVAIICFIAVLIAFAYIIRYFFREEKNRGNNYNKPYTTGYTIYKLQNTPNSEIPTISIQQGDPQWEEAINNWQNMKNPTNSPEWKKGVFALTKEIE